VRSVTVSSGQLMSETTFKGGSPDPGRTPAESIERAMFEVKRIIVGQDRVIERLFVALLARGHCLLEGAPGLAKTLAAETLATVVGGSFVRLQFTPDLVPSDIVGTRIYRPSSERFDIELGPIFANVVLADEINRAPAKVQSALLEVMAERHVSVGGVTHAVPQPFMVLATQNPIESEGVYPLPEAQRDRFLMKVLIGFPTAWEEATIVRRMGVDPPTPERVFEPGALEALQHNVGDLSFGKRTSSAHSSLRSNRTIFGGGHTLWHSGHRLSMSPPRIGSGTDTHPLSHPWVVGGRRMSAPSL